MGSMKCKQSCPHSEELCLHHESQNGNKTSLIVRSCSLTWSHHLPGMFPASLGLHFPDIFFFFFWGYALQQ
jgi:hypothetical protein